MGDVFHGYIMRNLNRIKQEMLQTQTVDEVTIEALRTKLNLLKSQIGGGLTEFSKDPLNVFVKAGSPAAIRLANSPLMQPRLFNKPTQTPPKPQETSSLSATPSQNKTINNSTVSSLKERLARLRGNASDLMESSGSAK